MPADIPDDEWNLLYVAVTRAKTTLIITKTIRRILTVAGVRLHAVPSPYLTHLHSFSYIHASKTI